MRQTDHERERHHSLALANLTDKRRHDATHYCPANNTAQPRACEHLSVRIVYFPPTHSPFALMRCRICGVHLGRLLRPDFSRHFRAGRTRTPGQN